MDSWSMILRCRQHQHPGKVSVPDFTDGYVGFGTTAREPNGFERFTPALCIKAVTDAGLELCKEYF